MRVVKILFLCHLAALVFGIAGLLVMLPHPELWNWNLYFIEVFNFGISYAGSLHIIFGATTMLLFGLLLVGTRKTLIFFVASTTISLSMELIGTSTGLPFGPYSYTSFLGIKILDHVPYSIPLSWFYMGFTSYILASVIVPRLLQRGLVATTRLANADMQLPLSGHTSRKETLWSLVLGTYFLTVWDLALDPAMASNNLPLHFWIWHQTGPYFGMPISNLVGWSVTGLAFMGVSRLLWRTNLDPKRIIVWLPFGMYAVNIGFAIALDLSVSLWLPTLMAVFLGVVPASLVFFLQPGRKVERTAGVSNSLFKRISVLVLHRGSWVIARRKVKLVVEGLENVPRTGSVLIAARHFHHLYDGCILMRAVPRRLHVFVALDWVRKRWLRSFMESACSTVDWPIVLRAEQLNKNVTRSSETDSKAYSLDEARSYLRHAMKDSIRLLHDGEVLVVFPEAYPDIDPRNTPKGESHAALPFRQGFARLVEMVEKDEHTRVAIVPAGLSYVQNGCWNVTLRFGPALSRSDYIDSTHLVQDVEMRVRELSDEKTGIVSMYAGETIQL
ncbi:MAG TPA: carotenoid biosynthesis protein [Ktedonobacteraceae bacterium]